MHLIWLVLYLLDNRAQLLFWLLGLAGTHQLLYALPAFVTHIIPLMLTTLYNKALFAGSVVVLHSHCPRALPDSMYESPLMMAVLPYVARVGLHKLAMLEASF